MASGVEEAVCYTASCCLNITVIGRGWYGDKLRHVNQGQNNKKTRNVELNRAQCTGAFANVLFFNNFPPFAREQTRKLGLALLFLFVS